MISSYLFIYWHLVKFHIIYFYYLLFCIHGNSIEHSHLNRHINVHVVSTSI